MEPDRREFLKSAAAVSAPLFVPRSVWGANDRVVYGLIAAGGRGRYLHGMFLKLGAQCGAICDIYEPNLAEALKLAPAAKTYVDYKELLEKEKGLDAVVLAGPDHHHAPMIIASVESGKDAYAEKPLARTLAEGAQIVAAVRRTKRVVQVGMQRRSAESIIKAKKTVDDGVLGRITLVKPQWHWNVSRPLNNTPLPGKLDWQRFLGSAPQREVEPMRFRSWRVFKDYAGGNMTDQGTHLMDVVLWFTNSAPPKSAVCQGYLAKMTGAEHPDVFSAVFELDDLMATWTLDYCNSFQNGWSITFMGDKGTMILDEDGFRVFAEPWKPTNTPIVDEKAPVPVEPHIQNFMDCVKSRKDPNCTVEIAQRAVAGPHLANIAMFEERKARLARDLVTVS
jgi:predicted dehydrogenase